ncbi:MAG: carbon storage regulator CsrA [Anaerolineae bacterium]|nr:carbon storage regulator CsrA [Anaerolineae bacterium]
MLVLGRKINESVVIGDNITVTILAVDGDKIKIGIQAPAEIRILRGELYEAIKQENLRAADKTSTQLYEMLLPSLNQLLKSESQE